MAGDLLEAPPGLSLRHLSRKLTRSIHSKAVSDLWKRRAEFEDTLRHQRFRDLPGESPAQPDSYHGHGEWLHYLPGKWETTLLDPVFRLGLSQRLGYPAPGTGQRCGRTPLGVKQCQHILDSYGRHAACCTKGLHTRRRDRIRDLLAKLARQAGLTATTEQAVLIPDQIQPDGQPAQAVSAPSTGQMFTFLNRRAPSSGLMSRSTQSPLNTVWPRNFSEKSSQSAGHMAIGMVSHLQTLEKGMTPVVLEQYGRTAPRAQAIFNRIINH